ncbi:hypothetical protein NDU88_000390 [Pleurodeles waltl]|uniref:Uncharacterized protein n=1 Tax=Pleurodeles waltl TaxID=8319 RepID=A0AAV7N7T9_PLEWA|nr:hypothetical protein NDU88_000390 [Pleurodeles waltl]
MATTHHQPSQITHQQLVTQKGPVTRSFLMASFASLRHDRQTGKDLSTNLRDVRPNLEDVRDRVSALEDYKSGGDKKVEHLHKEVIRLPMRRILRIDHNKIIYTLKVCQQMQKGDDLNDYAWALFLQILDASADKAIQLDRLHRVGPPKPEKEAPVDILVCVHDLQPKK